MEDFAWLEDMIADDDIGILKVKKKSSALTTDEQLVSKFQEINHFFEKNGCAPTINLQNISEFQLASRLKAIRENPEQSMVLVDYDVYNLLSKN